MTFTIYSRSFILQEPRTTPWIGLAPCILLVYTHHTRYLQQGEELSKSVSSFIFTRHSLNPLGFRYYFPYCPYFTCLLSVFSLWSKDRLKIHIGILEVDRREDLQTVKQKEIRNRSLLSLSLNTLRRREFNLVSLVR